MEDGKNMFCASAQNEDRRKAQVEGIAETVNGTVDELRVGGNGGIGGLAFFAARLEKQMQELRAVFSYADN